MKLTIELTVQDALKVLQGLDLEEVTITTTDSVISVDTAEAKPKRKRRTKAQIAADKLKEEATEIANETEKKVEDKIVETYSESKVAEAVPKVTTEDTAEIEPPASITDDTTGEQFSSGDTPWAN